MKKNGTVKGYKDHIPLASRNGNVTVINTNLISSSYDGLMMDNISFSVIPHYVASSYSHYSSGGSSSNNNNNNNNNR